MLSQLVLAIAGVVFINLIAMTVAARALGIMVRTITFGIGPQVFAMGRFRLSLFPAGGHIRLAMSADATEGELVAGALDRAPRWKRVLLPLTGPLVLLGMGTVVLGAPAIDQFTQAFTQLVGGALSPLGKAQDLLQDVTIALGRVPPAQVLGITACKFAALNLLPFLGSNGLAAATGCIPQAALDSHAMARIRSLVLLPFTMLMLASWSLAIVVFVN
jgi:hypothetical protein